MASEKKLKAYQQSVLGRNPKSQLSLQLMALPALLATLLFSYFPMYGVIIAFKNYNIFKGIMASPWAASNGLEHFIDFFNTPAAMGVVLNTIKMAVLMLLFTTWPPMLLAILLNEVRGTAFLKTVQTCSYLPHFISWVILANIVGNIFGFFGIFNSVYTAFGNEPKMWLTDPNLFQGFVIGTDVWKEFGYNAVVFLAALTGISPSLYEAAAIDGASRWQSIRNITLPALIPTVVLLTTLAMGNVLNAGFDQVFNMYSPMVYSTGDIIDTYVYRIGITNMQFSLATAVGLFKSVVSFTLITVSYVLAYKFADYTIF